MKSTTWVMHVAGEPEPAVAAAVAQPSRSRQASGLRVGLIDNSKDNARLLLGLIGDRLRTEFGAEILYERKYTSALGADDEVIERFAREADCVITAMAD
jgi:hypothetical protein